MFTPRQILFEKGTMDYEMGQSIYDTFKDNKKTNIIFLTSNQTKQYISGDTHQDLYRNGKSTLVVGIKKSGNFQTCKPSANYQLPLVSGCMGQCEYCYLNTKLGTRPYIKVFVNLDDIFHNAKRHMARNPDGFTIFEGSATSDPVCVEPYTHALEKAILFFAKEEDARFRFVTKYNDVDTLLHLPHNDHTEIRFSLNAAPIIDKFEHLTASAPLRIEALKKVADSGYRVGVLIAPVFLLDNWKQDYEQLLLSLKDKIGNLPITFEIISHRYTPTAKNYITETFPETALPMDNDVRKYKMGQFGYGKYVYPKDELHEMKDFFESRIAELFPDGDILYII